MQSIGLGQRVCHLEGQAGCKGTHRLNYSNSQMYFLINVNMLALGLFNGSFLNGLNVSTLHGFVTFHSRQPTI